MSSNVIEYYIIGLMSGSSLDGLDIAYCRFIKNEQWHFEILQADTFPLGNWQQILKSATKLNNSELQELSVEFAIFQAEKVKHFVSKHHIEKLDAIVSHGHTIFHYPEKGITCQIGDGKTIAKMLNLPVINNLRQADIDKGGQGAPIVPIGDFHLFSEYTYCLNIGGIANISAKTDNGMIAFDICSANQVLNYYAHFCGLDYDNEGQMARKGQIHADLLKELNSISFYKQSYPKSLDNGFTQKVLEIIDFYNLEIEDTLATYCKHIAIQINDSIEKICNKERQAGANNQILITGGGAFNTFLVEQIESTCSCKCIVPNADIINYKEALVMAFIGVLRLRNEVNVLASVTGATENSCAGDLYLE